MTTPEQLKQDQEEFAAAFAEPDKEQHRPSEDEVFGITPETPEEGPAGDEASKGSPAVAVVIAPENEAPESGTAEPTETPAQEAAETPSKESAEQADGTEQVVTDDKRVQRLKSWEGRLKAEGAELEPHTDEEPLDAWEARLQSAQDELKAGKSGDDEAAYKGAVESLANDFGEEFVKAITTIAEHFAKKAATEGVSAGMDGIHSRIDEVIDGIKDYATKQHFEAMRIAHPDFDEIAESKEWADWLATKGDEAKAIANNGTAREVIKLINDFKKETQGAKDSELPDPAKAAVDESALDAAEGVRGGGGGIVLPDKPAPAKDDYMAAWAQAS